jgi:DNA-binding NarL/FixJ family response regulator
MRVSGHRPVSAERRAACRHGAGRHGAGDALLAPGVTRRLIAEFTRRTEPRQRPTATLDEITEREREVLTLIGLGLSNTEIVSQLQVSLSTAKTHIGRLLMKLGARDRASSS